MFYLSLTASGAGRQYGREPRTARSVTFPQRRRRQGTASLAFSPWLPALAGCGPTDPPGRQGGIAAWAWARPRARRRRPPRRRHPARRRAVLDRAHQLRQRRRSRSCASTSTGTRSTPTRGSCGCSATPTTSTAPATTAASPGRSRARPSAASRCTARPTWCTAPIAASCSTPARPSGRPAATAPPTAATGPHVVYNARTRAIRALDQRLRRRRRLPRLPERQPAGPLRRGRPAHSWRSTTACRPGVNNGDHDLFVDDDGRGYLAYTDWRGRATSSSSGWTSSTSRAPATSPGWASPAARGPALFRRDGRYYLTLADHALRRLHHRHGLPDRAAAAGALDRPRRRARSRSAPTSCGGPSAAVATLPGATARCSCCRAISGSRATGARPWPTTTGAARPSPPTAPSSPSAASATVQLAADRRPAGRGPRAPELDQSSGSDGFRLRCDIGRAAAPADLHRRRSRPAHRASASPPSPRAPPTPTWRSTWCSLDDDGLPAATLATSTVPAIRVGRTAREVAFQFEGVALVAGQRYGLRDPHRSRRRAATASPTATTATTPGASSGSARTAATAGTSSSTAPSSSRRRLGPSYFSVTWPVA